MLQQDEADDYVSWNRCKHIRFVTYLTPPSQWSASMTGQGM